MEDVNTSRHPRRTLVVLGTLGLLALGAAPAATALPLTQVSRPQDDPAPSYRPGPKGSNVPPPENEDKAPTRIYTNCTQVINDGRWPLYAGQPGYSPMLDPDGDGRAC